MSEDTLSELEQLAAVISSYSVPLLETWRSKVRQLSSARNLSKPALTDHIPDFLAELTKALLETPDTIKGCHQVGLRMALAHGVQRLHVGFNIEDIVTEYNLLRDCIHDLADEHCVAVAGQPLRILNCVIDGAISMAVRSYAKQSSLEVQRRREDYLAFVAHDLRTPVNAISIAAELLEKSGAGKTSAAAEKALRSLHRNAHQLIVLTNHILDENGGLQCDSGIQPVCRDVDLWLLVESLVHGLHPVAGKDGITLVNEVPDDMMAHADAMLIRRVFQNLLVNAIAHSPQGIIKISAKSVDPHGMLECEVSDNGCGIAAGQLPYIFDKYETDRRNREGIGLGLTICKTFVEAHGGEISVRSAPGKGAVFRFTLPGNKA